MNKIILFVIACCSLFNVRLSAQCNTLPDDCSNACNLGSLPAPPPCLPNGSNKIGATITLNVSNIGATVEHSALIGCAYPSADVWFSFTATGTELVLSITGGIITPNVGLYQGNNCNNLIGLGCFVGAGGSLTQNFSPLTPGTIYFLQISGSNLLDQGNFTMQLHNNLECANCLLSQSFSVDPFPVAGTYKPGQTVNFCFTVTDYNKTALNWLHGVVLSFGAGWDISTLTPKSISPSCSLTPGANWNFYQNVTSVNSGLTWGPGFFYETSAGDDPFYVIDGNPGNNFGDEGVGKSCPVKFCWQIATNSSGPCVSGASLSVGIKTTGDFLSGSWTSPGCEFDPVANFNASLSCCAPPAVTSVNTSCGLYNGRAIASGFGTGPWHYVWANSLGTTISDHSNINGTDTIVNLSPGQYFVTVLDAASCSNTGVATIGGQKDSFSVQIRNVSCYGNTSPDGQLTIIPYVPQNGPFLYSVNGSAQQNSNVFSNLSIGKYKVLVQNKYGCLDSVAATISQPDSIALGNPVITSATCIAGGSISVLATGGTGVLKYSWSDSKTGNVRNNLAGGSYGLTVTDQNLCSVTAAYSVGAAPKAITFSSPVIKNVTCYNGTDGSITASASGGVGNIKYIWNNHATTATITGLSANNYSVTASDTSGCSASTSYVVGYPSLISIDTAIITPVNCSIKGSIEVTASGGTGLLSYAWSNLQQGDSIIGLPAGPYILTVTDQNLCTVTATYTVSTAPNTLAFGPADITNISCAGYNNGSITVAAISGTGTIGYRWDTNDSTATISSLAPDTYTVTATDAAGCTATASYSVNEPPAITFGNAVIITANCNTGGSIEVQAFGGTGTLTYSWSNGQSGDSITNLPGGTYTLVVTDLNLCTDTATYKVAPATGVVKFDNPVINNLNCHGDNSGNITAIAIGGSGNFSYSWSNSATTASIDSLAEGTYAVTAKDDLGCSAIASYTVNEPTEITIGSPVITSSTCTVGGSIHVTASGGTGTLHYSWSNTQTGDSIINLGAGPYALTVTDQNSCSDTAAFTVGAGGSGISFISPVITNVNCFGGNNGSITIWTNGGVGIKKYSWSNNDSTTTITGLSGGSYSVTVKDANNCSASTTYFVDQPTVVSPNLVYSRLLCYGAGFDSASVSPTGGTKDYTYLWSNNSTTSVITNLTGGSFSVTITDAKNCAVSASGTIIQVPEPTLTAITQPHLCDNPPYEDVTLLTQGGAGPFTYDVPGFGTNTTGKFPGIPAGPEGSAITSYAYTVTDSFGCVKSNVFQILPGLKNVTFDVHTDSATCFGKNDGKITITPSSQQIGVLQYSLNGQGGQLDNVFTNLSAGTYTITVKNLIAGCSYDTTATVFQPVQHFVYANPDTISTGPGVANLITVSSDFQNPVFHWSPADGGLSCMDCDSPSATVNENRVYYVSAYDITDSNCIAIDSVVILFNGKTLVMPNAFTPNGDERNPSFGPIANSYLSIKSFRIYNRWGQLVHNTIDFWDGTFSGEDQPVGTYTYYIEVEMADPEKPGGTKTGKQQGTVILLR